MQLIDTHTHIFLPEFNSDRILTVEKALMNGINKMILPNVDSTTLSALNELRDAFPNICLPLIGLHPTSVNLDFEKELQVIDNEIAKRKYYGIGETGIDLYWDKTFLAQQIQAFEYQISIAKNNAMPIIIHIRNSFHEVFNVLEKHVSTELFGIFHCFSGDINQAEKAIEMGFLLGIGGVVTYKNSGLDKVVSKIPIQNIVLETDSPYLSPVPKRGQRNEPANIIYVVEKLSEIYKISPEEVAKIATENARRVFFI